MKKNSLFTVSAIFLGISIILTIIYNIPYFSKLEYGWIIGASYVSPYINIAELILTVLLLVGVITKKKPIFIIYFVSNFVLLTYSGIVQISSSASDTLSAFSKFGLAIFNLFLLFFILAMFKWKSRLDLLDNLNKNIEQTNNKKHADDLIKYKELLDMGAISSEEFEDKKKEILNL